MAKPKGERRARVAAVDGELKSVKASGDTYLQLVFETGHITLTPSSNREKNRDTAVSAIRALLK